MRACLFVGLGGFAGAVCRYLLSSLVPAAKGFPMGTLLVNFIGAVAIGMIAVFSQRLSISPRLILFFKTGVCGGFTTFSTFSLETAELFQNHRPAVGTLYTVVSVLLCLAGVLLCRIYNH